MENPPAKRREKVYVHRDRISELPEPILVHILCFLSQKKAFQTCTLSKSWRHLGSNRPLIDLRRTCETCPLEDLLGNRFCENCFSGNNEAFLSVLDDTFQRYHHRNIFTQEIRLEMFEAKVDSQSISALDKWIPMFIKPDTRVNTFRLRLLFDSWECFDLPSVVFQAEPLRELYLEGCRLNKCNVVLLKNLRKLSLIQVHLEDATLEKIMSGCPLLEHVVIEDCDGLKYFEISNKNHHLKYFEFSCYYGEITDQHSIEIDSRTLQSIRIIGCTKWYHNHNNYFPRLKSLYLSHVKLSTESFHSFSCNFPCLEELMFIFCRGFEEIKLSSCSIKRLTIQLITSIKKVAIDAPNIVFFEFSDWLSPTALSIATANSREWKSQLNLYSCTDAYGLIEMVKALSQSQISLTISEDLFFKIEQIGLGFIDTPVVVEHLILDIINFYPDSHPQFLNALFRICRPRYAYALDAHDQSDDKEATEFLWKTLIHEREQREYGWEQHLEEVSIEASDEKGRVWHHVQWTCLPEWSENLKIRFRFKWRD